MKTIAKLLTNSDFGTGTRNTPAFISFSRKFRNAMKKELATIGAELTAFNTGHFYLSGFYRTKEGQCTYFSISDVRHGFGFNREGYPQMLYRTAENEKDFTGGKNRYVTIAAGMAKTMDAQLYMQEYNVPFLFV